MVAALYVDAELVVEVPKLEVCQYQVSPAGGAPDRVKVTPVGEHCGEFDVGFPGLAGPELTVIAPDALLVVEPAPPFVTTHL